MEESSRLELKCVNDRIHWTRICVFTRQRMCFMCAQSTTLLKYTHMSSNKLELLQSVRILWQWNFVFRY